MACVCIDWRVFLSHYERLCWYRSSCDRGVECDCSLLRVLHTHPCTVSGLCKHCLHLVAYHMILGYVCYLEASTHAPPPEAWSIFGMLHLMMQVMNLWSDHVETLVLSPELCEAWLAPSHGIDLHDI